MKSDVYRKVLLPYLIPLVKSLSKVKIVQNNGVMFVRCFSGGPIFQLLAQQETAALL